MSFILILLSLIGFVVTGGLLFNRGGVSNYFLALFVLLFSIEQLDFLYVTGPFFSIAPQYFFFLFPICLLFGPCMYFHLRYLNADKRPSIYTYLLHGIPFLLYSAYTFQLLKMAPSLRIAYVTDHFHEEIMPLNYFKALHTLLYGFLSIHMIQKKHNTMNSVQLRYCIIIVALYFITAVIQSILTLTAESEAVFIYYFISASTIALFAGYVLYAHPQWLTVFHGKYFHSQLHKSDLVRIARKIQSFFAEPKNVCDRDISLDTLSETIAEKKHHVSQTLSAHLQTSFPKLLNENRIQLAKTMLEDPSLSHLKILAIAFETGFTNKNSFYRAFAQHEDCTPHAYRLKALEG